MKVIDILVAPMGAGSSFLGYLQNLVKQENPESELKQWQFRLDGSSWDDYVLQFKPFKRLTPEQKQAKKKINNLSLLKEQDVKVFSELLDEGSEILLHYYPFQMIPYVDLNNRFFLSCSKELFRKCWLLGISKNSNQSYDKWEEQCEWEWQNHVETKIKCTFDYHVDYEELYWEPDEKVINTLLESPDRKWHDMNPIIELCTKYGELNKRLMENVGK